MANKLKHLLWLLVLAIPFSARAQSSFIVPVTTTGGQAVIGASVALTCLSGGCGTSSYSASTDNSGNAQFTNVTAGTYTITTSGSGIATNSYTFTVASPTGGAGIPYGTGTGPAQVQAVTTTPNITSLTTGTFVTWLPSAANTAAAPTLTAGTTATKPITKFGTVALVAGDLLPTVWAVAQYDGTEWVLQNPATAAEGGLPTSGGTANAHTLTISPAITAYSAGLIFNFVPGNANSGATTIAVSGLSAQSITKCGTTALAANDLTTTAVAVILYDGTRFQLLNPQAVGCGGSGVVLVPPTTAANTIAPTANSVVGLTVVETTGTGTPDIADFCLTSACTNPTRVDSTGNLIAGSVISLAGVTVDNPGNGNRALILSALGDRIETASGTTGDFQGTVSVTASTSGSTTFNRAFTSAPRCVLTPITDPTATGVWWVTSSTTVVTANVKTSGTITFNYVCVGAPN